MRLFTENRDRGTLSQSPAEHLPATWNDSWNSKPFLTGCLCSWKIKLLNFKSDHTGEYEEILFKRDVLESAMTQRAQHHDYPELMTGTCLRNKHSSRVGSGPQSPPYTWTTVRAAASACVVQEAHLPRTSRMLPRSSGREDDPWQLPCSKRESISYNRCCSRVQTTSKEGSQAPQQRGTAGKTGAVAGGLALRSAFRPLHRAQHGFKILF